MEKNTFFLEGFFFLINKLQPKKIYLMSRKIGHTIKLTSTFQQLKNLYHNLKHYSKHWVDILLLLTLTTKTISD